MSDAFTFRQMASNDAQATVAAWQNQVKEFEDVVDPAYYNMIS